MGLVIADVCDKGLGAALFMTLFRSLLRAAVEHGLLSHAPAQVTADSSAERLKNAISLTNNYIAETHGNTGMFATILFGILDLRTGNLAYINCGHLPPLILDRMASETLRTDGIRFGVAPDAKHTIKEVALDRGDLLFAYTDGLTDTENPAGELLAIEDLICF